ncbi:2-oxo acid dehydrogenase subunit E2 [Salicibibacter cibi]|uniref:2-oxo acid dehydrogenase subunit E2 n=1 Tax=Salicibibacter cibi TaxID=2743001 RepID=UPI002483577E|nr:2-oxo acid dehydrogenase subunit E2 [Salicibibacter cibi]
MLRHLMKVWSSLSSKTLNRRLLKPCTGNGRCNNRCSKGKAGSDLLSGSTFTITNMGASSIEYFTPILSSNETGILGVGALQEELDLGDDGQVEKIKNVRSVQSGI